MRSNRLGRFRISEESLRKDWRELLLLFAQVVPVQITHDWSQRANEYLGYSDLFEEFEEISDAHAAPLYDLTFTRNLDGGGDIKAEKSKDPYAV